MLWAAHALQSVVTLTSASASAEIANAKFRLPALRFDRIVAREGAERLVERDGRLFRIHANSLDAEAATIVIPLDQLFDVRMVAALRFWRSITGRNPGPDPAKLSKARRERLLLALRALDGSMANATYRGIANALFGPGAGGRASWKTDDLRDRTIRLVRLGSSMMKGGYRRLLLHPYRGK